MSEFSEFCKAWKAKFPNEDLPTIWEDDIKASLTRHQKNLDYLKSEVQKEEFYIKFLERALSNAEARKSQSATISCDATNGSEANTSSSETPKRSSKSDFVTVITVNKREDASQEQQQLKASAEDRPRAPPKPFKQNYNRSVSSESPVKSNNKSEDIVAWTKQQILQQLQTKQTSSTTDGSDLSVSPLTLNLEEVQSSPTHGSYKRRISYENVSKTRQSYENVFNEVTAIRESENGEKKPSAVPVTDMDSEQGRVSRATAFFQQQQMPKMPPASAQGPPLPQRPPKRLSSSTDEAFYDSVPHEDNNIKYVDAEDYIYLLDRSEEEDRESEKEKNGTLKSFGSTVSDDSSSTGSLRRRLYANLTSLDDLDGSRSLNSKQQLVLQNFFDSEENYVAALNVLLHYSKALMAAVTSSQPVITKEEISCIFFHVPELYLHHSEFLTQIKCTKVAEWNLIQVAQLLRNLSETALPEYATFLANFKDALETTRKASQHSQQFADLARRIKLRVNQQQTTITLEDLLHKPVARIQRHVAVIQDLLDVSTQDEPAYIMLQEAQQVTKTFLSEFSNHQIQSLFPIQTSKNQPVLQSNRHLVKNGFMVELQPDGKRKQRHCFLFTDLIVCTKYKGAANLEIKWYLPLSQVSILIDDAASKPSVSAYTNVASLRSQAAAVRTQMERSTAGTDRQRKKLASLEAKLLLDSPNLPLKFAFKAKGASKVTQSFTFLLSSEFERTLWVEAAETLKRNVERLPPVHLQPEEVESYVKASRTAVEPLGSGVRTSTVPAMGGELQVIIHSLRGLVKHADVYVVIELDSYGHYFHKARTKMIIKSLEPRWEEDFHLELEGTRGLRVLVYEEDSKQSPVLRGKAELELSAAWLKSLKGPQYIPLTHQLSKSSLIRHSGTDELNLCLTMRYLSHDLTLRRPALRGTSSNIFGVPIEEVCAREKRSIPHIVTCCVREVERRGLDELGIYRVSGLATDIAKLRKAFDTRGLESDSLLRDVDVNSVSGLLKLYLRQLPEALFTDRLYPHFLHAFSTLDGAASMNGVEDITVEGGARSLTQLFSSLPQVNQTVIMFLLDHLIRVNSRDGKNKMSLHNLATVFGPTLLRPAPAANGADNLDLLAMGTIDVMAQAGILHFFLLRKQRRVPIQFPSSS